MQCDVCSKEGPRVRHISRSYGKGDQLLVIENVPLISCPHCCESYLTAGTLHTIERIKEDRRHLANQRAVAVAEFTEVDPVINSVE